MDNQDLDNSGGVPPEIESAPVTNSATPPTPGPEFESTGEAELDKRLAEPVLQGLQGIDTAQIWISAFLIVVVGLIVYSNAFRLPMQDADQNAIQGNHYLGSLTYLPEALKLAPDSPLPMATISITKRLFGDAIVPFRLENIALQLLNGVLVYLLCRRLLAKGVPEPVAMLAGLLTVVHPANTESVDYIVGRAGQLTTAFSLLAIVLFFRATDGNDGLRLRSLSLSLLAFLAAWTSGWQSILVPPILLFADWTARGGCTVRRAPIHAAYWALLVALLAVHFSAHVTLATEDVLLGKPAPATRYSQATAVNRGVMLMASGTGLTIDHDIPARNDAASDRDRQIGITIASSLLLVLGAAGVAMLALRIPLGLGLLWALGALLIPIFRMNSDAPFSERDLYFAICGIAVGVPWLLTKALTQNSIKIAAGVAAAIVLVAAAGGSYVRNRAWQDAYALWEGAMAETPNSPQPPKTLGSMHYNDAMIDLRHAADLARANQAPTAAAQRESAQQELNSAEALFRQVIEIVPTDSDVLRQLGLVYGATNKLDEAIAQLTASLHIAPLNQPCTIELASLLEAKAAETGSMNDRLRALDYFRRAEKLGELPPEVRVGFAGALASIGDLEGAQHELQLVVGKNTNSPAAGELRQVSSALHSLKDLESKAGQLITQNPKDPVAMRLHAQSLMARGRMLQAVYILDELLKQHPDDFDTWVLMGTARGIVGDQDTFISSWSTAPAVPAGGPPAWVLLATQTAASNHWQAAQKYLEYAASHNGGVTAPLMSLADIAGQLKQTQRQGQYLEDAAKANPSDPIPWLKLCDIAVASNNMGSAQKYLSEAERRGAPADEIASRRQKVGGTSSAPSTTFGTVIH